MARQKYNENQRAYIKQLNRINRAISTAEAQGYIMTNAVYKLINEKDPSGRITRPMIERLKKINLTSIKTKAAKYTEDGEIIRGALAVKLETEEKKRKASETRKRKALDKKQRAEAEKVQEAELIDDFIFNLIRENSDSKGAKSLEENMNRMIAEYGIDQIRRNFKNAKNEVIASCQSALLYNPWDSNHRDAVNTLWSIAKGSALTMEEAIELDEAYNDITEEFYR